MRPVVRVILLAGLLAALITATIRGRRQPRDLTAWKPSQDSQQRASRPRWKWHHRSCGGIEDLMTLESEFSQVVDCKRQLL